MDRPQPRHRGRAPSRKTHRKRISGRAATHNHRGHHAGRGGFLRNHACRRKRPDAFRHRLPQRHANLRPRRQDTQPRGRARRSRKTQIFLFEHQGGFCRMDRYQQRQQGCSVGIRLRLSLHSLRRHRRRLAHHARRQRGERQALHPEIPNQDQCRLPCQYGSNGGQCRHGSSANAGGIYAYGR